jgi:hypothetical protein
MDHHLQTVREIKITKKCCFNLEKKEGRNKQSKSECSSIIGVVDVVYRCTADQWFEMR